MIGWALLSAGAVSLISLAGLAVLPFSEARVRGILFVLISLATGALFGDAILHLLPEVFADPQKRVERSVAVLAGVFASFVLEKFLRWKHEHGLGEEPRIEPVGRILLLSDGLHNLMDGVLIGASYLASREIGIATTLAVALHELPHEIGDFAVLLHSGYSRSRALLFNFLCACVSLAGVLVAWLVHAGVSGFTEAAVAVTAGSFLYIAGANLTPELHKEVEPLKSLAQSLAMLAGVGLMWLLLD